MKTRICFILSIGMLTCASFAQSCPKWGDHEGAVQFLLQHKSNGTEADPACVHQAFATLSHDKKYTDTLIGLLDFERSTEHDDFITRGSLYPAIDALLMIGKSAIPGLIRAIKDNDNALIRTNAAHVLDGMYPNCAKEMIQRLELEAQKQNTSADQQERLRTAEKYVEGRHGAGKCKSN